MAITETRFFSLSSAFSQAMDYVPVMSTIVNIPHIVHKCIFAPKNDPQKIDAHTVKALTRQSKKCIRNIILLIPGFGNIFIFIFDLYAKRKAQSLLNEIAEDEPFSEENQKKLEQAAALGSVTAKVSLGLFYTTKYEQEKNTIDLIEGFLWYNDAADLANEESLSAMQQMCQRVNTTYTVETERLLTNLVKLNRVGSFYAAEQLIQRLSANQALEQKELEIETLQTLTRYYLECPHRNSELALNTIVYACKKLACNDGFLLLDSVIKKGSYINQVRAAKVILEIKQKTDVPAELLKRAVKICLSSDDPYIPQKLVDLSDSLRLSDSPDADELIVFMFKNVTADTKVNIAKNLIRRILLQGMGSISKQIFEQAIEICRAKIDNSDVRRVLKFLYEDQKYKNRAEAIEVLREIQGLDPQII